MPREPFLRVEPDASLLRDDVELVGSLVGQTIVAAEWGDFAPGVDFTDHEYLRLTLDDGRLVEVSSYGYDASGVLIGLVDDGVVERMDGVSPAG